jgi:hypothetical protein
MYRVERVERLPSALDDNVVYVSEDYEVAALKCACGCGHRVTLLLGDGHTVKEVSGSADVYPSIGVWDAPCRSHFWLRNGEVDWDEQYSEAEIRSAMRYQLGRHVEDRPSRASWRKRLVSWWRSVSRRRS